MAILVLVSADPSFDLLVFLKSISRSIDTCTVDTFHVEQMQARAIVQERLAIAAHELRALICPAILHVELAKAQHQLDQHLNVASQQLGAAVQVIEDLLEAHQANDRVVQSVANVAQAAADDSTSLLGLPGNSVSVQVDQAIAVGTSNHAALRRLLGNLIHNALKWDGAVNSARVQFHVEHSEILATITRSLEHDPNAQANILSQQWLQGARSHAIGLRAASLFASMCGWKIEQRSEQTWIVRMPLCSLEKLENTGVKSVAA